MQIFAKRIFMAAAPLLLTGCLWGPGKFASDLTLKKDGSFILDYKGEIVLQTPPDAETKAEPWKKEKARCRESGRIELDPFLSTVDEDDDDKVRPCSAEQLAEAKKDYETQTAARAKTKREEAEQMAKVFGLPGFDDDSNRAFAAKLGKYAGYRSVTYRGKGVFDVDYHFEGRATQDFIFPAMPDNDFLIPFVAIRRRADGSVLVTAPAFTGGAGPLGARAGAAAAGAMKEGPVSKAQGRFTIITNGEILTNNSEDGATPHAVGRSIRWDVGPAPPRFRRRSSASNRRRLRDSVRAVTVRPFQKGDSSVRHTILAALLAATAPAAFAAPVPKEQLLAPPANAAHYVVVSDAGKHGDLWRWTLPDGSIAYRHSQSLRGWISETDQVVKLGPDGLPVSMEARGITPNGDAAETFKTDGGKASWQSLSDNGSSEPRAAYYLPAGGVPLSYDTLVDKVAAAGEAGIDLLPTGHATAKLGPTMTIKGPSGSKTVRLAFVRGVLASPQPVWLDDKGKFFAQVAGMSIMPEGWEANAPAMRKFQDDATAAEVKAIAHSFLTAEAKAPVLFDNVRLFDADGGKFLDNQAVLVRDGKIASIGAAGSIAAGGVRVIDGKGKTLVPGIWDSHMHIGDDWDVLANMANGMTSFRSPGTSLERAESAVKRRASGDLLMGEPFISDIVDRKNPLAAQESLTVSSEAETIAAVRKIKEAGLWGVKFYTSMNPAWIKPGAAEAHRLGLHVHGHIPAGMRPLDAVRAGYDEITHLNFVVMQAMPQEVVDKANTAARVEGPARYTKDVDWKSPEMKAFIAELKQRGTIVDPTLVIFEQMLTMDGGVAAPAYAPYMGIISPVLDREFKQSGYPLKDGLTRDDYRKSYAKMLELVGVLHKAGVPLVAGTDGYGIEVVREVELYNQAGFTTAEALQSATIVPARVVGADKRTGSIAVGKEADMMLVDGDVSKDLGALRRVVTVVSDGYVMDADALRKAAGYTGRPK